MVATSPLTEALPPDLRITADDDFTEARWAQAMTYIVGRFKALEAFTPTWESALNALQLAGLGQINSTLAPLYAQLQAISYLGVIFKARSYSTATMNAGTKQFFVIPDDRKQFAPGIYLAIANATSPSIAMYGSFVSYDADTGSLIVTIDTVPPAHANEVHSDWIVFPAPQDTSTFATLTVSPALTGTPTAPTPTTGDATTRLATTAFVQNAINLLTETPPVSLNSLNKIANAIGADPNFSTTVNSALAAKAPISNPIFVGTPQAPTAVAGSNSTQIATTAFVQNAITAQLGGATFAPITSPVFLGAPAAPTAAPGTNTTQIATTAFVTGGIATAIANLKNSAPAALDTLGEIAAAIGNDPSYSSTVSSALALKAPLASPAFTGVPTAPTAAAGNNSTQVATTAYVDHAVSLVTAASGSVPSGGVAGQVLYNLGGSWQWQALAISDITSLSASLAAKLDSGTAASTYATLASPALTGTPTAPTAVAGTNTTQLATTAFVQTAVAGVVSTAPTGLNTLAKIASSLGGDTNFSGTMSSAMSAKAPLASPTFTGVPAAPTAAPGTNTTQIATTAFVMAAVGAGGGGGAPLNSPAFTGVPTAPTAAANTNTTQLATTAFVITQLGGYAPLASPVFSGAPTVPTPANPGVATGVLTAVNIEFVRGITDLLAPLASPALTGFPTAPTPGAGSNNTSIATTAFVQSTLANYAPLASPVLTGSPTAPTAVAGTNTTQLATTAFVQTALGPYAPKASPAFTGIPTAPTPATSDNSVQVATTAFVRAAITAYGASGTFAPIDSPTFTTVVYLPAPPAYDSSSRAARTSDVWADINVIMTGNGGFAGNAADPWGGPRTVTTFAYWHDQIPVAINASSGSYNSSTGYYGLTFNLASGINFVITLDANCNLAGFINAKVGQKGWIEFRQDANGGRAVSIGTVTYYNSGNGAYIWWNGNTAPFAVETNGGSANPYVVTANAYSTDIWHYEIMSSGHMFLKPYGKQLYYGSFFFGSTSSNPAGGA